MALGESTPHDETISVDGFTFCLEPWLVQKVGDMLVDVQWWGVSIKPSRPVAEWIDDEDCRMSYGRSLFVG